MSQVDIDIQLKVWKDLALSKQALIGAATDALGLDAECSATELKAALEKTVKVSKETGIEIIQTREKAEKEVAEMKALVASSGKAQAEAEAQIAVAVAAREAAERQMTVGRAENADAIKKARADVAEKQKELKAISKALADTPENVVKKLKALKMQKTEESKLRTQTDAKLKTVKKEKTALEAELAELKAQAEKMTPLAAQVLELHGLCQDQNKKIKSLSEDKKDVFKIPKIDKELLESLIPAEEDTEAEVKSKK